MKLNNKILHIVLTSVMTFMATSCNDDWLDVSDSVRSVDDYYETTVQAEQGLTGIYSGLMPLSYYNLYMCDVRCDDVWSDTADDKQRDYEDISSFDPNIYTLDTLNDAWVDLFNIVSNANLFLEKVADLEFDSEEVKASFLAEARFLRALAYFDLVRYFGRIPLSTTTLTSDEAFTLPQSEAEEVYEKVIVPDLRYAVENMQTTAYSYDGDEAGAGRATLPAAQALLGRVYLTMSGYPLYDTAKADSAAYFLKEVIDYAEEEDLYWAEDGDEWPHIWISDNDNKYHIFEIQYIAQVDYGNPMVYWSVPSLGSSYTQYVNFSMSGNAIYCDEGLAELFEENAADVRYTATVDEERNYFTKFFEHKIKRANLGYSDNADQIVNRYYFPINYPLIRLEDVMLMYAEIVGPTTEGIRLVNKIRTRAGLASLSGDELTEDGFAECVDDERRRELAFEGIRWHDIVRHNTYIELVQAKFAREGATNATYLNYIDNVVEGTYLYPIPDIQMKACEGLYEQNEAYQ